MEGEKREERNSRRKVARGGKGSGKERRAEEIVGRGRRLEEEEGKGRKPESPL